MLNDFMKAKAQQLLLSQVISDDGKARLQRRLSRSGIDVQVRTEGTLTSITKQNKPVAQAATTQTLEVMTNANERHTNAQQSLAYEQQRAQQIKDQNDPDVGLFNALKIFGYTDAEANQAVAEAQEFEAQHGRQHMQPYNAGKVEIGMESML